MNRILTAALTIVVLNGVARAQDGGIDWPRYQDMAVELMQQYLELCYASDEPAPESVHAFRRMVRDFRVTNVVK